MVGTFDTARGHASGSRDEQGWWRQAVVYQIYPRSFADGDGDGVGDLVGVASRIAYLRDLGIDAVWMSPFYPSALADGGYDVADHRDVDPRIGTLEQFDHLVAALHEAGIRLVVDIVPNHSSNLHPWFLEALASGPGSPARERYLFRAGSGPDGSRPPSDWTSVFGGPAWTRVPDGQWYLHLFAPEQPDWNWANPEVREDFLRTLAFWGDRGVDGFRVDVAHALAKRLPDPLPTQAELAAEDAFPDGDHPLWDRDEVHDIYRQWRTLFRRYSPPLTAVAEAWVPPRRRIRYAAPQGLGQAFNFDLLHTTWDARQVRDVIRENLDLARAAGTSSTWVLSNHDVVRHATRYGLSAADPEGRGWLRSGGRDPVEDRALGAIRARAVTLLTLALPGSAYLYQGEELGLPEVAGIPADQRQDPTFFRSAGSEVGRDGCRVPLPWTRGGPSFGFGSGGSHLPQPAWWGDYSVEAQTSRPWSTLDVYRRALAWRRRLRAGESLEWLDRGPDVVAFRRPGGWVSMTNFGTTPVPPVEGDLLWASDAAAVSAGTALPDTTVWIRQS